MNQFTNLPLFGGQDPEGQNPEGQDPGEAGKQLGMQRAEDHANTEWKSAAEQCVYRYAKANPELTVNDLWDGLEGLGLDTHEHRASGPVMKACARRGWIRRTQRTIKTTRPSRNRGDVAVWTSLIYQPVAKG